MKDLSYQLEALLFSSGKAMSEEQLGTITNAEPRRVRAALKDLSKAYAEREGALSLFNKGSSWKMHVRDEYLGLVRRIVAETELSRACMETLAVVAYNQPNILQSKVVDTRGSGAYEHLGELVGLGFVTKEKSGRSYKLRLTEKFFEYFDVEGPDGIKEVFKDVAVPEVPEAQRQLGELKVVDELPESVADDEKERLGALEVVDESGDAAAHVETVKMVATPEEVLEKRQFLDDIDKKIERIGSRNDEREDDESFKWHAPSAEGEESEGVAGEGGEGVAGEESDASPEGERVEGDVVELVESEAVEGGEEVVPGEPATDAPTDAIPDESPEALLDEKPKPEV